MKLLLIGLGNMGKNHLRVSRKLLSGMIHTLKVCDSNKELKADYTDYKKAIQEYQPTHVIIASSTPTHAEILNFCIEAKVKNVFVEKPITDTIENQRYVDCWETTKIMVGHIERFNPMIRRILQELDGKPIDSIICTRSGLIKNEPDYNLHLDLCIHDADVCQLLTRHLSPNFSRMGRSSKSNMCNMFFELNGVDCFLHADNKSPFKRRDIKVMGPGYMMEGDYINQKLSMNGEDIMIGKVEPLQEELYIFFHRQYTIEDLQEAIVNLKLVGA